MGFLDVQFLRILRMDFGVMRRWHNELYLSRTKVDFVKGGEGSIDETGMKKSRIETMTRSMVGMS